MGTNSPTLKPKCHGYFSWKNKGKNRQKQRNEPGNYALRGIRTPRRIHAARKRRRKTKGLTRS